MFKYIAKHLLKKSIYRRNHHNFQYLIILTLWFILIEKTAKSKLFFKNITS